MGKFKKIISLILVGTVCALPFFPVSLLIWKASTTQNDFVLANYQSYIDNQGNDDPSAGEIYPSVASHLSNQFGLSYDYFETAEAALNLIKKNTADIVNTTTYDLVNWVQGKSENELPIKKLDWAKFQIPNINNADDALALFVPELQGVLKGYDLDKDGQNDNLLEYGIPYFLQDYIFAYRGEEIQALSKPLNWKELLDTLSSDGVKERFSATKYPQIFAVEDPRSFLSIANNIYETENSGSEPSNDFDSIVNRYLNLADRFNKISSNVMALNPDANVILNKLATTQVQGAFCFNGDALYASFGGDEGEEATSDDFHIVKPTDTIAALDMFTINNNLSGEKEERAYRVLGELCLGIYEKADNSIAYPTDADYDPEASWTYRNFNYVNYTAPLKKINEYIMSNYFSDAEPKLKDLREKIFNVSLTDKNNFEQPISNLQKSNIAFAWVNFKASLS